MSNLLESVTDWIFSTDTCNNIDVAYIDLSKAFDSVVHSKLFIKLSQIGIEGDLKGWIVNYLSDRKQCTIIEGICSPFLDVTSGVPQGSVLGPLLFLIFMNDLPAFLMSKHSLSCSPTKLFADDIKIYHIINSLPDALFFQSVLNSIRHWCGTWQLSLNIGKCQILHLGKTNLKFSYGLNGIKLPAPSLVKDLGLLVDGSLSFTSHIASIASKARARCGVFLKSFISRDKNLMKQFFITYVRPTLEYGCVVWGPVSKGDINVLENVQKYFTNRIPGLQFLPYKKRLEMLSLESLHHRRVVADMTCLYSIVTGSLNASLSPHLVHIPPSITRGHNLKIYLPITRLSRSKQNFLSRTASRWNALPIVIMNSTSKNSFRKNVSNYIPDQFKTPHR